MVHFINLQFTDKNINHVLDYYLGLKDVFRSVSGFPLRPFRRTRHSSKNSEYR